MNIKICNAINEMRTIQFYYEGKLRIVEPHAHGVTTAGNIGLRAYQVDGFSSSGKFGWKMYDLQKAERIELLDYFNNARSGYKKSDKGIRQIYCEL